MKMSIFMEVAVFDGFRADVDEVAFLWPTSLSSEKAPRCLLTLLASVKLSLWEVSVSQIKFSNHAFSVQDHELD